MKMKVAKKSFRQNTNVQTSMGRPEDERGNDGVCLCVWYLFFCGPCSHKKTPSVHEDEGDGNLILGTAAIL